MKMQTFLMAMGLMVLGSVCGFAQAHSSVGTHFNAWQGPGLEFEQPIDPSLVWTVQGSFYDFFGAGYAVSAGLGIKTFSEPGMQGGFGAAYLNSNIYAGQGGVGVIPNLQLHAGYRWKVFPELALNVEAGGQLFAGAFPNEGVRVVMLPSLKMGLYFYF